MTAALADPLSAAGNSVPCPMPVLPALPDPCRRHPQIPSPQQAPIHNHTANPATIGAAAIHALNAANMAFLQVWIAIDAAAIGAITKHCGVLRPVEAKAIR